MTTFLCITSKEELLSYKENISELFLSCFNRKLDFSLWEWLYLQNPIQSPIVNLAFLNGELVGHYAFIPLKTNRYNVFLSATTMVSKKARKHNIFYDLAVKGYSLAQEIGCDIIIGFPNAISAPVHEKLLGWKIQKSFIINTRSYIFQQKKINADMITLDIDDNDFVQWRLSKPNTQYFWEEGLILKSYQNSLDLVYTDSMNFVLPQRPNNQRYNVLTQNLSLEKYKIFDYPFSYKILNTSIINPFFKIDLLMSDIF